MILAVTLWKNISSTKKIFLHSYAAFFRRFCLFCIFDAKVRNFHDITKKNDHYFSKKCHFFTFSLFHFWHLCFLIPKNTCYRIYIYYNIYKFNISYNIKMIYFLSPTLFSLLIPTPKPKCQKWKSEKLKNFGEAKQITGLPNYYRKKLKKTLNVKSE